MKSVPLCIAGRPAAIRVGGNQRVSIYHERSAWVREYLQSAPLGLQSPHASPPDDCGLSILLSRAGWPTLFFCLHCPLAERTLGMSACWDWAPVPPHAVAVLPEFAKGTLFFRDYLPLGLGGHRAWRGRACTGCFRSLWNHRQTADSQQLHFHPGWNRESPCYLPPKAGGSI